MTGDALETSMEFEFTVDVILDKSVGTPRAENAEYLMAIGIGGSLDQALQRATTEMVRWLEMPRFTPELKLSKLFYQEEVRSILNKTFPKLHYSAALIGWGSDRIFLLLSCDETYICSANQAGQETIPRLHLSENTRSAQ